MLDLMDIDWLRTNDRIRVYSIVLFFYVTHLRRELFQLL